MRQLLPAVFVVAVIVAGGYYYQQAHSQCKIPLQYDIGEIDPRFNLSKEDALAAVSDAESVWENGTGKNLFTYTPGAKFTVDFVYDDRQETSNEEEDARTALDEKQSKTEEIRSEYVDMESQYSALKSAYEEDLATYEKKLVAHNTEVEEWNRKGGAPENVYARLNSEETELASTRDQLTKTSDRLNTLVAALNRLGETGNTVVEDYNQDVSWYNSVFGGSREFTQGDYEGDHINIYQFSDQGELRRVLTHELGHALSLQHVEGDQSVMYYLMNGTLTDIVLSPEDMAEFHRVCGAN